MMMLRLPRLTRRVFSFNMLAIAMSATVLLLSGCGAAKYDPEDTMVGGGGACVCNGTTLHCDAQHNQVAVDQPDSEYCDAAVIQATGLCACDGTDLACQTSVCTFNMGGCFGLGAQKYVTACSPGTNTNSQFPTEKGKNPTGSFGVILFPNDPQCSGGLAPVPAPPSGPKPASGGCFEACDPNTPACATGLSCLPRADGSTICYADSCASQSAPVTSEAPADPCGNGVCDPGEHVYNCSIDCGNPPASGGSGSGGSGGACANSCGNGLCESACGENSVSCVPDCYKP
jgi:hypothetical protein